jgi:hypothetical protein
VARLLFIDRETYRERIDILSETIYDILEPIEAMTLTTQEWQNRQSSIVDFATNGEVVYGLV